MPSKMDDKILDLSERVIAILNAADDRIREHAYNWITLDMEVVRELKRSGAYERLPDASVEFLRRHPRRLERHIDVKRKLHAATLARLAILEDDLRRLEASLDD